MSQFQLYEESSPLIADMNERLKDGSFFPYYQTFKHKYFLIECQIAFPETVQEKLKSFVPVIRKCQSDSTMFSSYQKDVINRMKLTFDRRTPVNVSDFAIQWQSLSLSYLELLDKLGVQIVRIRSCSTAFAAPILRPLASRILTLKAKSQTAFFKNLVKLIG